MEQEFDLRIYWNILKRRYILLLTLFIGLFVIVCMVAILLPREYISTATILVESQQIPDELAKSTVTASAAERVQIIKQRLMTRNNLLEIAREFKLFPKKKGRYSPTEIVEKMRIGAQIEKIETGEPGRSRRRNTQSIAFTVTFTYINANVAARVANKFVELVLEQNIQTRRSRASETYQFFKRQQQNHEQELAKVETEIIKFKNDNINSLPDSLTFRRTQHAQIQSRLSEVTRKVDLLGEEKKLWLARAQDGLASIVPDADANSTQNQLEKLRIQLVQSRGLYSDRHPEVKKVLSQILALEIATNKTPAKTDVKPEKIFTIEDLKLNTSVDPKLLSQLSLIEQQIRGLNNEKSLLDERAKSLRNSILKTSQVEISLNALNRSHEGLKAQLLLTQGKVNAAEVGESMEEGRQAERFEIIEQATAPDEPDKPDRPKIILGGLFGSVIMSLGLVVVLELLNKHVRGSGGLQRKLQIEPILAIPYISTKLERSARMRKLFIMFTLSVIIIIGAFMLVDILYLPLDLVAEKILKVLGLTNVLDAI